MIVGIGIDIVEITRFNRLVSNKKFMERVFTKNEIKLINSNPTIAADNFCVKEALVKAYGTGFRKIDPSHIEVLRNSDGAPIVNFYEEASEFFSSFKTHISISNTNKLSTAYVIIEELK